MSRLLHRLVSEARGADRVVAQRIEPLLAPRLAGRPTAGDMPSLREVQADVPAHTALTSAPARTQTSTVQTRSPTIVTPERARWIPPEHTHDAGVRESPQLIASPTLPPQPPSQELIEGTREESVLGNPAPPILPATIVPAQKAPAPVRATAEASRPTQVAGRQSPAIEEHTQTITISIGRVEVRSPPAAPVPSRRPAFKPGMSLDAFLGRGRSDER